MSRKTPDALRAQVRTLADAADAAARWFRAPEAAALSDARTARLRARGWRAAAVTAAKPLRGGAKADAADMSFALREAVEHAVGAVSDAALWSVGPDADFADAAASLRDGALALARAASASGDARAEGLVAAKRLASEAERRRLKARSDAHESPFFVESVKRSEIASRLSSSAEALQQACDALAGSLAE